MLPRYAIHCKLITQNDHKLTEIPSEIQWHMHLENKLIPFCSDCVSSYVAVGLFSFRHNLDYVIHLQRTC
jgi:hypothetical protein